VKNRRSFLLNGAAPEKSSLEKAQDTTMFQGMMIEELIKSVERAEQHAREQQNTRMNLRDNNLASGGRITKYRELVEVA